VIDIDKLQKSAYKREALGLRASFAGVVILILLGTTFKTKFLKTEASTAHQSGIKTNPGIKEHHDKSTKK